MHMLVRVYQLAIPTAGNVMWYVCNPAYRGAAGSR